MPAPVSLRRDFSTEELRRFAKSARTISRGRRLLSLAAVLDWMSWADAARIGGMDRQTLRDWVHRFNEAGPDGLLDHWSKGPAPRLSAAQREELAAIVETGPNREVDGVVRWRRVDLQRVIKERFGVDYHEPSRSPELNPVENIWQYLRANWLSNRVFETYDAIHLRIPTEAGRGYRFEAGQGSDLKPATIPR